MHDSTADAPQRPAFEELEEAALRRAVEIADLGLFEFDLGSDRLVFDARAAQVFGAPLVHSAAWDEWLECVHPRDRETVVAFREDALAARDEVTQTMAFRYLGPKGDERWISARCRPRRDDCREVDGLTGVVVDETGRRLEELRSIWLTSTLQHRTKNLLSVVRAISRSTAETAVDLDDYVSHFDGRLAALARVQGVVTRGAGRGADLEELLREEFLQQAALEGGQFELRGPQVMIDARSAETLGLALHELAVNALKFGALATRHGRIEVAWSVETEASGRWLMFDWRETGVPVIATNPSRSGFGRQLLEEGLPYQLSAETSFQIEPGGARCRIRLPLSPTDRAE